MIFDKDNLLKEIIRKTLDVLEQLGVDDDAATGYTDFDIYNSDGRTVIEVKTSFNDDIVKKLADELNPIVQKYDDNSYFEIDDNGNIFAYLVDNSVHLKDSLKELDKKLFDEFDESLELEALYEATQTDLTADEERKIKDFISKPGITAEEAKTFITGMQKSKGIHEDIEMVDYTPDVTMTFENACGIDEVPNNYNIGDTLVCDSDLCLEDGITIPAGKTFILIDTCGVCDCPEIKFDNEFYNLIHSGEGAPLIALVMDLVDFMDNDEINPYLPVMESKKVTESLNESLSNKTVQKTNTKSLRESLKERDSEDFRNLNESFELESLYESVKDKFDKEAITQIKECVENKKNSSREIAKLIEGLSKGDKTYLVKLSESFSENERFAYELAKEMNLDFEEADNLLHDLNNLRADEWFDTVLDRCSDETIEKFITTYNLGKAQFESLEEDTSTNTVDVKELIRKEFYIKPWKNFKQAHSRKLMYKANDVEDIAGIFGKKSREDKLEDGIKKLEDFLSDIDGCSVKFEHSYDGSLPVPVVNVRYPLQLESLEEGLVHFLETYKGYDINRDVATGDFFATDKDGNEKFVDCDSVEDVKNLIDSSLTEDLDEEDIYSLLDSELGGRGYDSGLFDVLLDYCKNNSISEEQLRRLDTDELEILTLMAEGEEVTNWRASDEDNEYWLSVEKSLRDKFSLNESLNESKEIDSILEKVNNAFKETGFELDKNIKHENPSKGLFTDYHYQIVNLNHNFDVEDEEGSYEKLKEISEPLINRLHKLEGNGEEFNFTWNFGVDKEGHCTAGVDLRLSKELKDKETVNEALEEDFNPMGKYRKIIDFLKGIFPEDVHWSHDDYRLNSDDFGGGMRFQIEFDSKDENLVNDIMSQIENHFYGVKCSQGFGRDWDYYISVEVEEKALNEALGRDLVKLEDILDKCEDLAKELPQDVHAKETRKNYVDAVYHAVVRELKPIGHVGEDGKKYVYRDDSKNEYRLELKHLPAAISGNLASWYADEIKVNTNAPSEWRKEVEKLIIDEFKRVYKTEELKEDFWNPSNEFEKFTDVWQEVSYEQETEFDNWNTWDQAKRDEFATEVCKRFLDKYFQSYTFDFGALFDDLEENNYHTEYKILRKMFNDRLDSRKNESLTEDTANDTRVVQYDITLTSDSLSRPRDIENALESYGIEVLGIEYGPYDEEFNSFIVDMIDSEDVDSEHIIEYLTNHSINVVDAQPTESWIINDYMGKLSEGLEENDSTNAYELANNIVDYVSDIASNIWVDLRSYKDLPHGFVELLFDIDNGDWKHEHLYFDTLVTDYLKGTPYQIMFSDEDVYEEDGSDTYSSTHQFVLKKVEG